jgi:DNA polymerase III delta subunit
VIQLLTGENDFELTKKVAQLRANFDGSAERYDAADLSAEQLADIFAGQTLFALKRLVVIDQPSANSDLWHNLPAWNDRLSEDTVLVLVEPKLDKRTSTYKWLQKNADVQTYDLIDPRDTTKLVKWIEQYAKQHGVALTAHQARRLAARAGGRQWELSHAVDKLALLDTVTDEWIDTVIEQQPMESVFALFETALNGDVERLAESLEQLRQTEEPYRLFGLMVAQGLQLATLVYGDGNVQKVAADTGAKSSYPFQKLAPFANRLNKRQASELIKLLATADIRLKSSDADPWIVVENCLTRVASL